MTRIITIIVLLFISFTLYSQTATIQDNDGWVNIRSHPSSSSKVIHKVYEGEFFFWNKEDNESNWIEITIPKNKYSLDDNLDRSPSIKGYIHKSRLLPVENISIYQGNNFYFEYILEEFNANGKNIDYLQNEIYKINGRFIFGNNYSTPSKQVKEINVVLNGESIPMHEIFFQDIFECDNNFKVYILNDFYIVNHWNSDGAEAYEITWVFKSNKLVQRLVGTIF